MARSGSINLTWVINTVLACFLAPLLVGPGEAQQLGWPQSPILTISTDRMYQESAFGRRVANEIEAESAVLAAQNRQIEAELMSEEQELTERRPEMTPKDFRVLADAFDKKVQDIRRAQDAKARNLAEKSDQGRVDFLQAARPILAGLMQESGAGVILERSSVFLSANAIDLTDSAIERINQAIGDGTADADQ